jgi:O-antigen/teichoic acid export membrane protein
VIARIAELFKHQGFTRYFRNTSWMMGERVMRMVVGLFVGIWVARYLGPEQFGLLNYAQSFVFLFTAIATLGLDGIVVRELLRNKADRDVLLGTSFTLKLAGSLIILLVLIISTSLVNDDNFTKLLVIVIASATLFQSFNVIDFYFQSEVSSKYVAIANTVSLGLSSIIKVVLIIKQAPLVAFAAMSVFDALVLSAGLIIFYQRCRSLKVFNWTFDFTVAKNLLLDSWPLVLSGAAVAIYMKIDQIMIKQILSSQDVGYYAAATKLTEVWLFITVILTKSLFPALVNAKKQSEQIYLSRLKKMYQILIFIALLISIMVSFSAKELVLFTFGIEFIPSVSILSIYIWSIIFVYMNNASWSWYVIENIQKLALIRVCLGAVINVVLNIYLIDSYGLTGAAVATLISYSIASYFGNILSRKTWLNFRLLTLAFIDAVTFKGVLR